jgi:hypothetical protein
MENKNLQAAYIERLNILLPTLDFAKLDHSCNSNKDGYAKEILKQLHDAFIEVHGTDYLEVGSYEFIELPAVIRGRNTGHIGLGIVTIDLESSGEHWGTFFLTPNGVIDQNGEKLKSAESKYLSTVYIPYNYWYTVTVERDHHVNFDDIPEKVAKMLEYCHQQQETNQRQNYPDGPIEMR